MRKYLFTGCITCLYLSALPQAQSPRTLQDLIVTAQTQSPVFRLANNRREISYYQFLTYKSDFKPQVSFYGNAPVYSKEYYGVRQPDGTIIYQPISQTNSNMGIGISQQLPFSGGEISLNSDLALFDDLRSKNRQYSGTPFYIRLAQPLFAVNELKWKRKIEPLKFEESKKGYVQELESIAQQVVKLYFDIFEAQSNRQIALGNAQIAAANYEIEKKRSFLGTTTEDKVLQLELQTLRSKQDYEKASYEYHIAQLNLKTYVGIKDTAELNLAEPDTIPHLVVNLSEALEHAKKNRPEFVEFERKKQEAQRDVAQAKAQKQQVLLVASYGLNNVDERLGGVYTNPNDQQRFSIGFNIPILDWGRRSARYHTAKSLEKLTETTNEFDEITIYQEITTLVRNMELLNSSMALSQKADEVARRRYTIANNLYQTGKLSLTDLSLAQSEKDNTRRAFINVLRTYWTSFYLLRRLTLYDFERQAPLFQAGN
jgi:outer membrane protein TolC